MFAERPAACSKQHLAHVVVVERVGRVAAHQPGRQGSDYMPVLRHYFVISGVGQKPWPKPAQSSQRGTDPLKIFMRQLDGGRKDIFIPVWQSGLTLRQGAETCLESVKFCEIHSSFEKAPRGTDRLTFVLSSISTMGSTSIGLGVFWGSRWAEACVQ